MDKSKTIGKKAVSNGVDNILVSSKLTLAKIWSKRVLTVLKEKNSWILTTSGIYQQELVSCHNCKRCKEKGPSHLYWFYYPRKKRYRNKKYCGKHLFYTAGIIIEQSLLNK